MDFSRRNHPVIIFILNIIMISAACAMITGCHPGKSPASSAGKQSTDHYRDSLSVIEVPYNGTEDSDWLLAVKKTAKVMTDNHFTYDRKGIKSTLNKASEDNRHGDCAHLISWALQDYGILDDGETFYSNSKGSLSCGRDSSTYAHLEENCDIIETGGISCSDTKALKEILHPGDICCYNKHMNVVEGIDKKGNILYYDAGLVPTEKEDGKIYYTDKLTKPFSRKTITFKRYKLHTIIRIRDH